MMGYYKLYANIYSFHIAAVSSFFGYESCYRKKKFVLLFTSGVPKALNSIIGTCIMSQGRISLDRSS